MSKYEISFPANPASTDREDIDSPNREILTPEGARILLNVKEHAFGKMMKTGLPAVETSNSYRLVRHQVIEWMEKEAERQGIARSQSQELE